MYKLTHKSSRNFIAIMFPLFITACASNPRHVSMLRSGDQISIQSPEPTEKFFRFGYGSNG
ncbi:MAG: hypothetical protein ACI9N9_001797 [Enterobacterales bacterium]|jgi:hypothetical protein